MSIATPPRPATVQAAASTPAQRAARLNEIIAYGATKAAEQGLKAGDGNAIVHEARAKRSSR